MGLNQEELAKRMGVSKSAIAKWETNEGISDRDNLKKICETACRGAEHKNGQN